MDMCILVFHLPPNMRNSDVGKFVKQLYGQETSTQKGRYRYRRKGLLDTIPHRKLQRGVVIIRMSDMENVMKLLNEWHAVVEMRIIQPTAEDIEILQEALK